jgi:hypothetical protein
MQHLREAIGFPLRFVRVSANYDSTVTTNGQIDVNGVNASFARRISLDFRALMEFLPQNQTIKSSKILNRQKGMSESEASLPCGRMLLGNRKVSFPLARS